MPATNNLSPSIQPYADNGTNYQSNNPDFIQRDENGNIIIDQGDGNNQNLVLETVSLNYFNSSVVNNIDTRFKYFKFPAENIAIPDISFEGFGIEDLVDFTFAKFGPAENDALTATQGWGQLDMSNVLAGNLQEADSINKYNITTLIKQSGNDLRFRIRLSHNYRSVERLADVGVVGFTFDNDGLPEISYKTPFSQLPEPLKTVWTNEGLSGQQWNTSLVTPNTYPSSIFPNNAFVSDSLIIYQYYRNKGSSVANATQQTRDWLEENDGFLGAAVGKYNLDADEITANVEKAKEVSIAASVGIPGSVFFRLEQLKSDGTTSTIQLFPSPGQNQDGVVETELTSNPPEITEYDIIIPNSSFEVGDKFSISSIVGQWTNNESSYEGTANPRLQHTLLKDGTYWSITDASKNVDINNIEIETP